MTAAMQLDLAAITAPAAGFFETDTAAANALLTCWGHYLGPSDRPFGSQAWRLDVGGEPVSVAISASTVSATVGGYARRQVVELARLCTRPGEQWATRVTLRLWRQVGAPAWPYWDVAAAVAYSDNKRHPGHIYRTDGWRRLTDRAGAPSGPNATWSKQRAEGHPARGRKSLWLWQYDTPTIKEVQR
ncbi:hypothetical protein ABZZ79_00925 [Streptomyces sp. NPDC006458]|uniref:hypothetical protein n=1 Tax=Streptomyces sp. NPDC006458 TaxID=3154302 RepID=UPI0033A9B9B0